ncbi:MAG: M50 family metallopeptidase [Candidatus Levyibacteriota bacterium]
MEILIFILILTVLVLIHEAGHFFVAKKLGIKVEEFGFGIPPRIFGIKRGETIYSVNWLPIGGFVKLYGEDSAGGGKVGKSQHPVKDIGRAFFARPAWQRALVIVAGVVMNFILATVIISYLFGVAGVPVAGDKVIVAGVSPSSPAEQAGLSEGDVVVSVNDVFIKSPTQLTDYTKQHLGEELRVAVEKENGETKELSLTPRKQYPAGQGPMGVSVATNIAIKKYPWYQAPVIGLAESLKTSWMIASSLGTTIFQLVTKAQVPQGVAGPVGIAQLTGQFVQVGPMAVLSLVSILSLNLAVLNILPIPALDGGRLFFILIEMVTRKKVSQKYEGYAHAAGMVLLLGLIALITFHDITRLISGVPLLPK